MCTNFWHARWDLFASHLFLHPRNPQVSNSPSSMALKKSQIPKNATKSVGGSTCSSTSIGPMTRNKAKAIRLLTSQEVEGKAPVTKLISAPAQPKTVISLNTLRTSKHTSSRRGDSAFALEDSTIGSEYHYSTSDVGSSTPSQASSSQGSPREVTSSIFLENSSRMIAMAAMMMKTATIDEKIAEMGHAIAKLTKTVKEKDLQIAMLMNKLEV